MQLRLKNSALAQQHTTANCTLAAAALSPLRPNALRRPVIATRSAVLEAVQQAATETVQLPSSVLQQPSCVQTCQLSAADFHQMFTMGETLGQGSYGKVRACTQKETGKQYAVKIISKRKGDEDRTDIILREVDMWSRLSSSRHIADLIGAFEDNNNVFIVQELLSGGDLQSLLDAQTTLSEDEAKTAMRGVLTALAACHEQEICYGDVKPSNFILANMYPSILHVLDPAKPKGDLDLRLVDFGCAQICPEGCSMMQGLSGTPVYMAPEVISGQCHSISMDVWAAGIMLYQMLTAQFPFWDTDMAGLFRIHPRQILKDIQASEIALCHDVCGRLSPGAKDLIRKMLTKDPTQRISAAEALQHPWLQQQ
jgi:serine/threonine protein kinase